MQIVVTQIPLVVRPALDGLAALPVPLAALTVVMLGKVTNPRAIHRIIALDHYRGDDLAEK